MNQVEKSYSGFKRIFYWIFQQPITGLSYGILSTLISLPLSIFYTRDQLKVRNGEDWSISELLAYGLIIFGLGLKCVADLELNDWENSGNENQACDKGLRRRLRYPDYYGELLFWLGIWGVCIASFDDVLVTNFVYWPIGWVLLALAVTLIIVPRLDKLNSVKKGWSAYENRVRFGVIPFFRF